MLKQIVERSIKNGPNSNTPMAAERVSALRSGWRDLNSRPLDPQIGGLVVSCDPELRFKDCGGGRDPLCDRALNSLGPIWAQVVRLIANASPVIQDLVRRRTGQCVGCIANT